MGFAVIRMLYKCCSIWTIPPYLYYTDVLSHGQRRHPIIIQTLIACTVIPSFDERFIACPVIPSLDKRFIAWPSYLHDKRLII